MQREPLRGGGQRPRKMSRPARWTEMCGEKGKDVTGLATPGRRDPRPSAQSSPWDSPGGPEGTLSPRRPQPPAQRVPASPGPDPFRPPPLHVFLKKSLWVGELRLWEHRGGPHGRQCFQTPPRTVTPHRQLGVQSPSIHGAQLFLSRQGPSAHGAASPSILWLTLPASPIPVSPRSSCQTGCCSPRPFLSNNPRFLRKGLCPAGFHGGVRMETSALGEQTQLSPSSVLTPGTTAREAGSTRGQHLPLCSSQDLQASEPSPDSTLGRNAATPKASCHKPAGLPTPVPPASVCIYTISPAAGGVVPLLQTELTPEFRGRDAQTPAPRVENRDHEVFREISDSDLRHRLRVSPPSDEEKGNTNGRRGNTPHPLLG